MALSPKEAMLNRLAKLNMSRVPANNLSTIRQTNLQQPQRPVAQPSVGALPSSPYISSPAMQPPIGGVARGMTPSFGQQPNQPYNPYSQNVLSALGLYGQLQQNLNYPQMPQQPFRNEFGGMDTGAKTPLQNMRAPEPQNAAGWRQALGMPPPSSSFNKPQLGMPGQQVLAGGNPYANAGPQQTYETLRQNYLSGVRNQPSSPDMDDFIGRNPQNQMPFGDRMGAMFGGGFAGMPVLNPNPSVSPSNLPVGPSFKKGGLVSKKKAIAQKPMNTKPVVEKVSQKEKASVKAKVEKKYASGGKINLKQCSVSTTGKNVKHKNKW